MEKNNKERLKKYNFLLFLVIFLGAILRLWSLGNGPESFLSKEALLGWRANSILTIGKDETGRLFPLIFSSFNGYQLPFSTYLLIPFLKIFGLSVFGIKLPFVLMGIIGIWVLYKTVLLIFPKNRELALWVAFFLAINPWEIYLSRSCSSTALAFNLFLFGFYFYLSNINSLSFKNSFLTVMFWSLSLYSDKASWFFIFPFLIFGSIYFLKKNLSKEFFLLFLIWLPLLFSYIKAPQAKIDFLSNDLNLFQEISIINSINAMRGEISKSGYWFLGKLFYNKLFYLVKITDNFLVHFNPRFYFASGDKNPFHGLTNFGPILFGFLPVFFWGIKNIFKEERKLFYFLIIWFVLGIIPSLFLFLVPNQERVIFVLPVLAIFSGYGLQRLNKKFKILFLILLTFNFLIVGYDVIKKEPKRFEEKKQIGFENLGIWLAEKGSGYKKIYVTDSYGQDPGPFLLFYLDYPPIDFLRETKIKFSYRTWINYFGNVFIDNPQKWENIEKDVVYIFSQKDKNLINHNYKVIDVIKDKENPLFYVCVEKSKDE